ncbi:hypothetical protein BUALT_Bualt02G0012500 [Buddleja alternifolia]|uniref:Uncharacterized protein n=1 Tax=Buddleja alternifolia TaxID=168488 RepID=A0AAV6Y4I8_9LAMI|nr:hypothetical protein BUALT_Bualt02G0012500 [Buddleja alternifolia]
MDHHQEGSSNGRLEDIAERRKLIARGVFNVEDVNKQADEFIKNFRKQLRFERLESLKRRQSEGSEGTLPAYAADGVVPKDSSTGGCRKIDDKVERRRMVLNLMRQFVVDDVNKQADDFIKNFQKQLKFEREESLRRRYSPGNTKN